MSSKVKDFSLGLKRQLEQKITTQKEDTISELEKENKNLLDKLKEYESKKDISGTLPVKIDEIIIESNIRDSFEFEDIPSLAQSIKEVGQLQPVLLSKDNHLIAGYRRYNAVKLLGEEGPNFLYVLKLEQNFSDIDQDLFLKIQYSENEKRKSLDSFHLSNLFNQFLDSGKSQKEISEIFGVSKGYVSSIVSIKNMLPELKKFIKEFQVYAWSKEKFTQVNSKEDISQNSFYQVNRGIIGWNILYKISKHENLLEQKKEFLKAFKDRLSEDELNSEYFKNVNQNIILDKDKFSNAIKSCKSFSKSINEIKDNLSEEDFKNAEKYIDKIEKIFLKYYKTLSLKM